MPARHLAPSTGRWRRRSGLAKVTPLELSRLARVVVPAALIGLVLILVSVLATSRRHADDAAPSAPVAGAGGATIAAPQPIPAAVESTSPPASSSPVSVPVAGAAARIETKPGSDPTGELNALTAGLGTGGVSVAALNLTTGATFSYGAAGGMTMGSIAKLDTIEVLLLQHQDTHTTLTDDEVDLATSMIEQSDNDAADSLWTDVGSDPAVQAANLRLGIPSLAVGTGGYWGLGTTGAADQITLLKNLAITGGVLDSASQQFALNLMRSVTSGQRWGVGTIADAGSKFANKNGWLGVDGDDGRWLVNSDGIVTVHGQQVLISVLTQHNDNEADGITLVENIAGVVAQVISPS